MSLLRLVSFREERRQRRRGRRATDAPEDTEGRMAMLTVGFWLGWAMSSFLGAGWFQ